MNVRMTTTTMMIVVKIGFQDVPKNKFLSLPSLLGPVRSNQPTDFERTWEMEERRTCTG